MRVAISEIEDKVPSRTTRENPGWIAPLVGKKMGRLHIQAARINLTTSAMRLWGNHSKALRRDLQICRGDLAGALVVLQLIGDLLAFIESADSGSL